MLVGQFILKVNKVIEQVIAPQLAKDQGGIELVDIQDKNILVKLTGACKGCQRSQITLKDFVQAQLRELVDGEINVAEVL
jgi:NifU-like protein